jgi:branched-chain amino acid transport system permease protein
VTAPITTRLDRRAGAIATGVVVVALLAAVPKWFDSTQTKGWSEALYIAVAALGLNLLTGYNGQISIGHGALFGVGAYTSAILMQDHGWRWLATLPVVVVLSAVVGALVGFPALRVKGLYLALITLGLAALFPDVVQRYVHGTGGTSLVQPRLVTTPGWAERFVDKPGPGIFDDDQWRYWMALAAGVILFVLARNLVRGRFGRALVAVRDQETAAATLGIDTARVKVAAFSLSAIYAGVAGALSVLVEGVANTDKVGVFQQSITFLVAVVVGGTATVAGPVIGAYVVVYLEHATKGLIHDKPVLSPAIFGGVLIVFMYVLPDGIVGGARRLMSRWRLRGGASPPAIRQPALEAKGT